MSDLNLALNANISIFDENDFAYRCVIQGINEDDILINIPMGEGKFYFLDENIEYEMNYCDEFSYYTFKTTLLEKVNNEENNIPLYRLQNPYDVIKIQRRDFVRVDLGDCIKFQREEETQWYEGLILDLSGGGIRFSTYEKLEIDQLLKCRLMLNSDEEVLINAKIIRCDGKNMRYQYVYAIEYVDIKELIREKIIRRVYKQLIKQR